MTTLDKLKAKYDAQQRDKLTAQIATQALWWVTNAANSDSLMLYDTNARLLWDAHPKTDQPYTLADANKKVQTLSIAGLKDWYLPTEADLWAVAGITDFPLQVKPRKGRQILDKDFWLCSTGDLFMIDGSTSSSYSSLFGPMSNIFCCNNRVIQKTDQQFLEFCISNQWDLVSCADIAAQPLLHSLYSTPALSTLYPAIDYIRARLPYLEDLQFTDPAKGLWEFWGMDATTLKEQNLRARNPALDIRDWNVAIDFGTSSTVVAYSENGQSKLLRIGVDDFWKQQKPEHYENPTVLEFVDFPAFIDAWQAEAYQPLVSWDDVRCSHEALYNLRNNETDPAVVASILCKIKQWALREGKDTRTRITDRQHGLEHELSPLTLLQPVKGEALAVNNEYPFDPVELYAWYLGLTINWRGRGLFLRYYMTFPVDYPADIKQKILASFRRGLQRSLPETLVNQEAFQLFKVEERGSEPAAYAAAALPELGIEPSVEGVPYAVFDFGGGTADFDFGYYRLPTAEEDEAGTEIVMEHFGSSGDKFLGGENLLENMAYRVFLHNIEVCRKQKIAFTRPLDADDFPGSEMFLEKTQAALTNSLMLVSRLRPLWETGKSKNSSGIEKIKLINRDGQPAQCEFEIPEQALLEYLEERIEQGVVNFFIAMKKAFADKLPKDIHILLAGNASRSTMVQTLFGLASNYDEDLIMSDSSLNMLEKLFGNNTPTLNVHPPLPMDEENVYRPTGKTGVALGLLKLCPGSALDVINRTVENSLGEAPFAFFIGRIRAQRFQATLKQGDAYLQWQEMGAYREGVFNLVYTQSPKAHTDEMSDGEAGLIYKRLDLLGGNSKLFTQIIAPDKIQLCTATSIEALNAGVFENLRELKLG